MGAIKVVGRRALIGRGFLGSVLDQPGRFTDRYHSKNIDQLRGAYDLIVIAAPSASKYHVNAYPRCDQEHSFSLIDGLLRCDTRRAVLLSTIDATKDHPYGQHRKFLERQVTEHFPGAVVIRLPALFGDGLKKNALFDLLKGAPVANQVYHWYNVDRLWDDVRRAQPGLHTPYSEPLSMWEIAEALGLTHMVIERRDQSKDYNEKGPYTMSSVQALREIVDWATSVRPSLRGPSPAR